jgi:glycosyltransferase involved in cell wall biosynthesis
MISVLTITYQRSHLLEEAIESFLRQNFTGESEMIIINDSDKVDYVFNHPKIKIYNIKTRFSSIWEKLKFGFNHATYNHIYRLDDDDLLTPWALKNSWDDIVENPNYEIYRSNGHYFFIHNVYQHVSDNVNNGNIYTKPYIERITPFMKNVANGEDSMMSFGFDAKIFMSRKQEKTMIYRWGMGTYHVSGMGLNTNEDIRTRTDELVEIIATERNRNIEAGVLNLQPHFINEYYHQLPIDYATK